MQPFFVVSVQIYTLAYQAVAPLQTNSFSNTGDEWWTPLRFLGLSVALLFLQFPELFLGTHSMFFRDFGASSFPIAYYNRETLLHGQIPLWNPYHHCGVPYLAQWNTVVLYPPLWLTFLLPTTWGLSVFCLGHILIGGLGLYRLVHQFTVNRFASTLAGLIFVFNGVSTNSFTWPSIISSLSLMPWVISSTRQAYISGLRKLPAAALLGTLQMLTGGVEMILFTWIVIGLFWLAEPANSWAERLRQGGRLGSLTIWIGALTAVQLLPFFELLRYSERSVDVSSSFSSMPATGWANLVLPLFKMKPLANGLYFQEGQFWLTSYYLGSHTVAMALLGFLFRPRRLDLVLGLGTLFFLLVALGENGPLYKPILTVFPAAGLIRFPVKYVLPLTVLLPFLGARALARWQASTIEQRRTRSWIIASSIVILIIAGLVGVDSLRPASTLESEALWRNGIERALWLGLASTGLYLLSCNQTWRWIRLLQLSVLLILWIDLLTHAPRQVLIVDKSAFAMDLQSLRSTIAMPALGQGRIMLGSNARKTFDYSFPTDPVKAVVGQRLVFYCNLNLLEAVPKVDGLYPLNLEPTAQVEHMLYARPQPPPALADYLGIRLISASNDVTGWMERSTSLPLITAGQSPIFLDDHEAMAWINSGNFQPASQLILPLHLRSMIKASRQTSAMISQIRFQPEMISFEVNTEGPSFVSIAQSWYPRWRADIDGREVPLWRANRAFQALEVPSGNSHITLHYVDRPFQLGAFVSLTTLLATVILIVRLRCSPVGLPKLVPTVTVAP